MVVVSVDRLQPGPGVLVRPLERPRPETEHGLTPAQSPISAAGQPDMPREDGGKASSGSVASSSGSAASGCLVCHPEGGPQWAERGKYRCPRCPAR